MCVSAVFTCGCDPICKYENSSYAVIENRTGKSITLKLHDPSDGFCSDTERESEECGFFDLTLAENETKKFLVDVSKRESVCSTPFTKTKRTEDNGGPIYFSKTTFASFVVCDELHSHQKYAVLGEGMDCDPGAKPIASVPELVLVDLPKESSHETNLKVTVKGPNIGQFKYALDVVRDCMSFSKISCDSASYGDWQAPSEGIHKDIESCGEHLLCVRGKNAMGDETLKEYRWGKPDCPNPVYDESCRFKPIAN
jgi:hypothetical protein